MSFTFEKYTEKSYVVRGDTLNDSTKRKEFVKKLQGNGIWNTRLKNGPGLLVSINDHNKELLEKTAEEEKPTDESHSSHEPSDPDDKESDKNSEKRRSHVDSDDDTPPVVEDKKESRRSPSSSLSKKFKKDDDSRRRKYDSSSSDSESDHKVEKGRKKGSRYSYSSSESEDDSYRGKRSHKGTPGRSPYSSRGSSVDKYHRSRSPVSSSDSEDSSEDERIQHTIRRKRDNMNRKDKEVLETPVESDSEDIITCSRRIRGLMKRVEQLEKLLGEKKGTK